MSATSKPDPQPQRFIRRSETESICASCFVSVRTDQYLPIEVAEDIHGDVCLVRPDSVVGDAFL